MCNDVLSSTIRIDAECPSQTKRLHIGDPAGGRRPEINSEETLRLKAGLCLLGFGTFLYLPDK